MFFVQLLPCGADKFKLAREFIRDAASPSKP